MGMFNWVDYECTCPVCKSGKVSDFQTKEGLFDYENGPTLLSKHDVSNFYGCCSKCHCWIEFTLIKNKKFTMVAIGKDDKELVRKERTLR